MFKNTFKDIARIIACWERATDAVSSTSATTSATSITSRTSSIEKLITPPFFVQLIFGVLGGIGPDIANLMFMKQTADRLFGTDYLWSVLAAGRWQMPFAAQSVLLGGSVRVGLEDSLFIDRGKLASSNAEQVSKVRTIVEALGHEIATPAEVRQSLGLKGADAVAF